MNPLKKILERMTYLNLIKTNEDCSMYVIILLLFFGCGSSEPESDKCSSIIISSQLLKEIDPEASTLILLPNTVCSTCTEAYHSLIISEAFGESSHFILGNPNRKSRTKFNGVDNLSTVRSLEDVSSCVNPNLITVLVEIEKGEYLIVGEKNIENLIHSIKVLNAEQADEAKGGNLQKLSVENYDLPTGTVMIQHVDALQEGLRLFTTKVNPPDARGIPMFYYFDKEGRLDVLCDTLPGGIPHKGFSGVSTENRTSGIYYSDGVVRFDQFSRRLTEFQELDYGDCFPAYYFHTVFSTLGGHVRPLTSYQYPKSARLAHIDKPIKRLTFFGPSVINQPTSIYPDGQAGKSIYSCSEDSKKIVVANNDHNGFLIYNTHENYVFPAFFYSVIPVFDEIIRVYPECTYADFSLISFSVRGDNVNVVVRVNLESREGLFLLQVDGHSNEFKYSSLLFPEEEVIAVNFVDSALFVTSVSDVDKLLKVERYTYLP